jgi:phthalate 4,5-dioxygenase oxygenase subunit
MLSREDNDLITRVSNGAPLGRLFRQHFWIPAVPSAELVADGAPVRVRLLGENFVAFRSTDGRLGFFDEGCPHRGASLLLARNEGNGLRCIFHGWKYDVSGKCVEAPTQFKNAEAFCKTVPLKHYAIREAGGIAWVWLGEGAETPKFPELPFTQVAPESRHVTYQDVNSNWLQGAEGNMDSAHVGILHSTTVKHLPGSDLKLAAKNTAPRYEIEARPYGFRYAAIRALSDGTDYVRINTYVAPWYAIICPNDKASPALVIITTPIDDENMRFWLVPFIVGQPLPANGFNSLAPTISNWPPLPPGDRSNSWGQSRDLMSRGHFTGFPQHVFTEDFAVALSQGPIVDRSKEFLNSGDGACVRLRQILLQAVKEFQAGKAPEIATNEKIDYSKATSIGAVVPSESDWRTIAA